MPNAKVQPFTVGEVVLTSLDALLSAAALHLGEPMPDGRKLEASDPQEAWHALLAASGLMNHVGALMREEHRLKLEERLAGLLARFAEQHGKAEFSVPNHLLATLAR